MCRGLEREMNCMELNTAPRMNSKAGKYIQITTILAEDADSPSFLFKKNTIHYLT